MNLPDDVIARLLDDRTADLKWQKKPPPPFSEVDPNQALHSLYGRGNTVRALTGTGARPQEVLTPQCVVDALARLWPEGVALDPCGAPDALVRAEKCYWVRGVPDGKKTQYALKPGDLGDGLTLPWLERTYVNPPFEHLQEWLEKAAREPREQVILAPVRTHRRWFRKAMIRSNDVIWLDGSFKFVGYDQSFPAPLCILYRGDRDVAGAFKELGEPA